MTHRVRLLVLAALASGVLAVACDDDGSDGGDGGNGTGAGGTGGSTANADLTVACSGADAPTGSVAIVMWQVTSGSPDYLYKQGQGSVTGNQISIDLPEQLAEEAKNDYGTGVGFVVVLPAGTQIPDGEVDGDTVLNDMIGIGVDGSIIWKDDGATDPAWIDGFPTGFSCGTCVDSGSSGTFDSFSPVDCSSLTIELSAGASVCNWT